MTAPFGLSAFGFRAKRLNDVKTDLDNQFTGEFGEINLTPQSVFGQEIGVLSKVIADLWENLEQVYFSQYPNSADGVALDNVVQFNGITRLPATATQVTGLATGIEGTLLPAGVLARVAGTNQIFASTLPVTISQTNASLATVNVGALAGQIYTILLDGIPYRYALPHLVFSASFTAGDVSTVIVNNVVLGTVTFTTTSDDMLAAIAALIATDSSVDTATPTNPDQIDVVPNLGFYAAITSINTTGGSAPTMTQTFNVPESLATVANFLAALINANSSSITAVANAANVFLTSDTSNVPFSLSVGLNLSVTSRTSPVNFEAQENGPIPVPVGTLTDIVTPLAGWSTLTNSVEGSLGRNVETDAQLRLRRLQSLRLPGRGTVEAIRAQLLAAGATSALVFENQTMLQNPASFVIASDMTSGDSITIQLNGISQTPIPFTTNMLTTMLLLAAQLEAFPGVASASVGGTGNRTMSLTFVQGFEVQITNILISPTPIGSIISNGRPPKSFEAVVQGQTNEVIANTIWYSKPAGIQTFGTTQQPITDSQGDTQVIHFSRPTEIFIWVNATLTLYAEEDFPSNGLELVQNTINAYINSLGIGEDVLLQRVQAAIFAIPGISSSVMTLAATGSLAESPSYAAANIPIGENQIAISQNSIIVVTI